MLVKLGISHPEFGGGSGHCRQCAVIVSGIRMRTFTPRRIIVPVANHRAPPSSGAALFAGTGRLNVLPVSCRSAFSLASLQTMRSERLIYPATCDHHRRAGSSERLRSCPPSHSLSLRCCDS